ncbi:MAG: hypothetical protein KC620_24170, partial [Myxococcales bacterium]|nr:hypothetical protein [Myxococcales bacterium]
MRAVSGLFFLLLAATAAAAPPGVDLLQFRTDNPEVWERAHRTSDALPLTLAELEKLAAAGVAEPTLIEMMRTRKVMAVADAEALVKLKKAGATDAAVAALSAYAMPPNDHFDLRVILDVASPTGVHKAPFLYIDVRSAEGDRQEAFLHADLRGLMRKGVGVQVNRDRADPFLPETVRSVTFTGPVETHRAGRIVVSVLASQKAGLSDLANLTAADAGRVKRFEFDYPSVSLERRCELRLVLARDPVLTDEYAVRDGGLDCRWD